MWPQKGIDLSRVSVKLINSNDYIQYLHFRRGGGMLVYICITNPVNRVVSLEQ